MPSKGVEKTYEVRIKGRVRDEDLQVIANGVALEDGITAPATIVDLGFDDHNGVHEVEITCSFLRCSKATVYAYRSRVRLKSIDLINSMKWYKNYKLKPFPFP